MRASNHKTIFNKGYMTNWTNKPVTVSMPVAPRKGTKRRVYKLMDYKNKTVKGSGYTEEIQEVLDN